MAKGEFKCSECSRTFTMAAHLARHRNAVHGAKRAGRRTTGRAARGGRKTARSARTPARPAPRRATAPPARTPQGAAGMTRLVADLQAYHRELTAQRAGLDQQIAAIDSALQAMDIRPANPTVRRAARRPARRPAAQSGKAGSLKEYIVKVLRGSSKPMSPKEIADSAVKAGYKTKAKNLVNIVSNSLPDTPGVKKAGRGLYRA